MRNEVLRMERVTYKEDEAEISTSVFSVQRIACSFVFPTMVWEWMR